MSSLRRRTSVNLQSACFCAATIARKTVRIIATSASSKTIAWLPTTRCSEPFLYLGEINDERQAAWRKTLSVFDEEQQEYANLSLFPDDREIPADAGRPGGNAGNVPVSCGQEKTPRGRSARRALWAGSVLLFNIEVNLGCRAIVNYLLAI